MLTESRRVCVSASEDIQLLIWNFERENSTKKMLLLAKQKLQTHLLMESCEIKKILIHKERTYSR